MTSGDGNHYLYSTGSNGNATYLGEYSGTFHFVDTSTGSDVVTITGGQVGVGKSPSYPLEVNGDIGTSGSLHGEPTGPDPWSCGQTNWSRGIDVSSNNGSGIGTTAYWTTAQSSGYTFAIIKATEGISYVNPYLGAAWTAANQVLGVGNVWLYHFLDWQYSGKDRADNFYSSIIGLSNPTVDYALTYFALDVEEPNGSSSAGTPSMSVVDDFMNELSLKIWGTSGDNAGFVIYTNEDTWVNLLGNPSMYADTLLWLAALGTSETYCPPYTFGAWVDWTLMQYRQVTFEGTLTDVNQLAV